MNTRKLTPVIFAVLIWSACFLPVRSYGKQHVYPSVILTPADNKEMIFVPAGPKTKAFYIDKYEVTFGDFAKFVKASDYSIVNWDLSGKGTYQYKGSFDDALALEDYIDSIAKYGIKDMSVICLTLDDAKAYAKWAGKRIPTEAEWSLAAGGVNHYKYAWGKKYRIKTKDTFYDLALKREKLFEKMSPPCNSPDRAFDRTDWGDRFIFGMGTQPFEWTVSKSKKEKNKYIIKGSMYNPLVHYFEYEMRNSHKTLSEGFYRFNSVGFRCVLDSDMIKVK